MPSYMLNRKPRDSNQRKPALATKSWKHTSVEHTSISKSVYSISNTKLGKGSYGCVVLGDRLLDDASRAAVAIKCIAHGRMKPAALEREVQIMKRLSHSDHPNLPKFHTWLKPGSTCLRNEAGELPAMSNEMHYIIMEPGYGGELFQRVIQAGKLAEQDAAFLFSQIVSAMLRAHELGIAHRDLKLENILLAEKDGPISSATVKVIDWGLAHQHAIDEDGSVILETLHSRCGSKSYMPPEVSNRVVLEKAGYNAFTADVWSLGVCIFATLFGFFPFDQSDPEADWRARRVLEAQSKGLSTIDTILGFYPQESFDISTEAAALLDRMLIFRPHERCSLSDVARSAWLTREYFVETETGMSEGMQMLLEDSDFQPQPSVVLRGGTTASASNKVKSNLSSGSASTTSSVTASLARLQELEQRQRLQQQYAAEPLTPKAYSAMTATTPLRNQ